MHGCGAIVRTVRGREEDTRNNTAVTKEVTLLISFCLKSVILYHCSMDMLSSTIMYKYLAYNIQSYLLHSIVPSKSEISSSIVLTPSISTNPALPPPCQLYYQNRSQQKQSHESCRCWEWWFGRIGGTYECDILVRSLKADYMMWLSHNIKPNAAQLW